METGIKMIMRLTLLLGYSSLKTCNAYIGCMRNHSCNHALQHPPPDHRRRRNLRNLGSLHQFQKLHGPLHCRHGSIRDTCNGDIEHVILGPCSFDMVPTLPTQVWSGCASNKLMAGDPVSSDISCEVLMPWPGNSEIMNCSPSLHKFF